MIGLHILRFNFDGKPRAVQVYGSTEIFNCLRNNCVNDPCRQDRTIGNVYNRDAMLVGQVLTNKHGDMRYINLYVGECA
jgi:hypothetical protein